MKTVATKSEQPSKDDRLAWAAWTPRDRMHVEIVMRMERMNLLRKLYVQKRMPEHDLYFGQLPLLEYACLHDGCTQVEMAQALDVSPASIAVSTKRLQKAGLLTKTTDESDLRVKRLSATPEGIARARRGREVFTELDKRTFEGFTADELSTLAELLERIGKNLGGAINRDLGLETAPLHKLAEEVLKHAPPDPREGGRCRKENKEEPFR